MRAPIEITVTEEQNRAFHKANISEHVRRLKAVKRENAKRLASAEVELAEAIEWAKDEGA